MKAQSQDAGWMPAPRGVVQYAADVLVVRAEHGLERREGLLEVDPRLGGLALGLEEAREAQEAQRRVRRRVFPQRDAAPRAVLGAGGVAREAPRAAQSGERREGRPVVRPEDALADREARGVPLHRGDVVADVRQGAREVRQRRRAELVPGAEGFYVDVQRGAVRLQRAVVVAAVLEQARPVRADDAARGPAARVRGVQRLRKIGPRVVEAPRGPVEQGEVVEAVQPRASSG